MTPRLIRGGHRRDGKSPCPEPCTAPCRLVAGLALAFGDHSDILSRAAPLTVFAPMDSAFAKVDNSTLEKLLADTEALRGVLARHMVANMEVR